MEPSPTQYQTSDVSQDVRLAAEMRKLTITPMHDNVTPESISDAEVANQHVLSGALPNSPYESEATVASHVEQTTSKASHRTALAYSTTIVVLLTVATSIAFMTR